MVRKVPGSLNGCTWELLWSSARSNLSCRTKAGASEREHVKWLNKKPCNPALQGARTLVQVEREEHPLCEPSADPGCCACWLSLSFQWDAADTLPPAPPEALWNLIRPSGQHRCRCNSLGLACCNHFCSVSTQLFTFQLKLAQLLSAPL